MIDFQVTPAGAIDLDALSKELRTALSNAKVTGASYNGTVVTVHLDDAVTSADKSLATNIVKAHTPPAKPGAALKGKTIKSLNAADQATLLQLIAAQLGWLDENGNLNIP